MKQRYDEWDLLFEQVSGDTSWMPARVVRVTRPEISYSFDPQGNPSYCVVQRVDSSLADYGALIDEVMRAHAPCGASHFPVTAASMSTPLFKALEERGFACLGKADTWSIDVNSPRSEPPDDIEVRRVETLQGMRDMDLVMSRCFEHHEMKSEETLRFDLKATQGEEASCCRFVAYDAASGAPLATSALNIFPQQEVGFMWGGSTVSEARGRGVYSALITHRMRFAQGRSLKRIGLHAARETSAPIIERQGFERHGPVLYWKKSLA